MTHVLVSGGTGIVGRFVVEHLLGHRYKVSVGGRHRPATDLFSAPVGFVPLCLDPDVDQVEAFDDIYYFVHAALDHVPGRYRGGEGQDPAGFRKTNLDGTIALFEAARDAGVRRCIFLSSRAAYPPLPAGTPLHETLHGRPDTLYGDIKLQAEHGLQALCGHSFVTASLRATGVYGAPRQGQTHKWESLFSDYLAGHKAPVRAATEVHGDDLARAVRLMLEADAMRINGETFNVSDILVDTSDLLSIVRELTHCPHPLPPAADKAQVNAMNTCKLQALGWSPGGENLLRRTIADLVADTQKPSAVHQIQAGSRLPSSQIT